MRPRLPHQCLPRRAVVGLHNPQVHGLLAEIIPFLYVPREDVSADIRRRIISVIEVEETMSASDFYFSDSADHMCNYLGQEVESGVTMGALVKLAVFLGGTETDVKFARAAAEKLRSLWTSK